MEDTRFLTIDRKQVALGEERNLLELIRRAGIELPTFCYHSELSVYGACRLCMVEVEGRGLVPACSVLPEAGMKVLTSTEQIRSMRKIIVELLLANHDQKCPTCPKNNHCQLQALAGRLGIKNVRFKNVLKTAPADESSHSLVRDPNKCVLCGDCVRMCSEVQGVGAIDFAHRGSNAMVTPCFGKDLGEVECVYCGQCSRVCPTGALTPKPEIEGVWKDLHDKSLVVVAQIAPAVRVAVGELFGLEPGEGATGQIVAALKSIGFNKVFDTSFTADLTVIEEGHEFLTRMKKGENIPQFTSCCPAWVKFAEQYYPKILNNLSSCRSPQQMFGAITKEFLASSLGVTRDKIRVVSVMPCTAKKYEAKRPEFTREGIADVDYVLTTQELGKMIEEAGLCFDCLEPESFDMPFGFKTGAGVIFGASGGVSEAVLRFAVEKITGSKNDNYEFHAVRGDSGVREAIFNLNGREYRFAVVSGLKNARDLVDKILNGEVKYDLVEVMACPGGCIGGAGQPVYRDVNVRKKRAKGIYDNDKMLQLHKAQDNPYLAELYKNFIGEPNSHVAHKFLHTGYKSHKRLFDEGVALSAPGGDKKLEVDVCFGTGCFLKGSQRLLRGLLEYIRANGYDKSLDVKASFCFESCDKGPMVKVGGECVYGCDLEKLIDVIKSKL